MKKRFRPTRLALALCLCTAHSFSTESDNVATILAKWRAAVRAPRDSHHAAELVRTSDDDGFHSTEHIWVRRNGGFRKFVDRGQDNELVVASPSEAWYRDWNGNVRRLTGEELQRLRTEIAEESTIAFGPSVGLESIHLHSDEAAHQYVLNLDVEGGKPMTWLLDANTFLPVKAVRPGDEDDVTTEYRDWKTASGGIQLPHVAETSLGERSSTATLQRVRWVHVENEDWGKPAPTSQGPIFGNGSHEVQIPFNFENGHIMIQCRLNGSSPIWFLVDTGASTSVVNAGRIHEFPLHPYGQSSTTGGGGSTESRFAFPANFEVAGIELRNQHVGVLDLSGLEAVYGMKMGGLLGYDFLSQFVTEIDYGNSTLILHNPKTWTYHGQGEVIPLDFDNGIPHTSGQVAVQGKTIPAYFVVDSGAAGTINFTSPFVESKDLIRLAGTSKRPQQMAGSEKQFFAQTNLRGRIDALMLGRLSLKDVPVNLSVAQKGAYASKRFSGAIGEGVFSRFHIFFDYPNARLILEPTPDAEKPFSVGSTYGLTILASGKDLREFKVTGVRPGSPAEQQGFHVGDTISAVDERTTSSFSLGDLKKLFTAQGRKMTIRVSRQNGSETLPVSVSLVSTEQ